jgi:hypothetical protein
MVEYVVYVNNVDDTKVIETFDTLCFSRERERESESV